MRNAIVAGDLEPGRHYKERELCEIFSASRTTIRETVQYLVSEGLLLTIAYRGVAVPRIERGAARDLYRVRSALEGLACFEFTQHATQEQKVELARIVEDLGETTGEIATKEILQKKATTIAVCSTGRATRFSVNTSDYLITGSVSCAASVFLERVGCPRR